MKEKPLRLMFWYWIVLTRRFLWKLQILKVWVSKPQNFLWNQLMVIKKKNNNELTWVLVEKNNSLKGNCLRFKNVLNGEIEYEVPNNSLDTFNGFLKLKKDPKPEHFTINNIILRNSVMRFSRWFCFSNFPI